MDNIKKGDEITMKYWNPNSFVRVGWVHYESDGRVSIAGVNNKGAAYVRTGGWANDYIPWVKPNPFPFQVNDVLELVSEESGNLIRRVLVVGIGRGDTFNTREFTTNGLSSQFIVSLKVVPGGHWRKAARTKVLVGNVPTKFITERRAPKKGERYMSELDLPGKVSTACWDFSILCDVIIGEV